MARRPKLVSQSDYARRIGVNRSTVSRYVAGGMPTHAGQIDPEEANRWRGQNVDGSKPRSKPGPGASVPEPVADPGKPTAPEEPAPDLSVARARDTHYSAEMRKRRVLEFDRKHLSRAEVEGAWDTAAALYRQGLEGVAGRLAGQIAVLSDPAQIEDLLRDEHRRVLDAVADAFERAGLVEGGGAVAPGRGSTAATTQALDRPVGG